MRSILRSRVAAVAVGTAGLTALAGACLIGGYAAAHRTSESEAAGPAVTRQWTVNDLTDDDKSYILANVLPYYRVDAPSWCSEDMACWTGSNADSRTDREVFAAMRCDLARSSWDYAMPADNPDAVMAALDGTCGINDKGQQR